ncbi:hypothetical protein BpHYR1_028923 [Brachionus plicatilis]|uniref:CCHC-type domain-containing protein n=1 Tax=Brachionus plicatilis TaxID=10195 RepID=A0A3M7Q351_BRAPC|nr:hypothetical protein BpHYR1_028923 [Brachionus plicatilis]
MVKAICDSYQTVEKLIRFGVKVKYMNRRVEKFVKKPKLIMCYKCGQTGHKMDKCTGQSKCIRCSKTDHLSKDCPDKKMTEINFNVQIVATNTQQLMLDANISNKSSKKFIAKRK